MLLAGDSLAAISVLQTWLMEKQQQGYREASCDRILRKNDSWHIYIHIGSYYEWEELKIEGLSLSNLRKAGLDFPIHKRIPFQQPQLLEGFQKGLQLFEDQGYPFAQFEQSSINYRPMGQDSVAVSLSYRFQPGQLVKIDSIKFRGNPKERAEFIYAMMRIRPGDLYNQSLIDDIPRLLNNSIYYQQVKSPKVSFDAYGNSQLEVPSQKEKSREV